MPGDEPIWSSLYFGGYLGVIKSEQLFDPNDLHSISDPLVYSHQRWRRPFWWLT